MGKVTEEEGSGEKLFNACLTTPIPSTRALKLLCLLPSLIVKVTMSWDHCVTLFTYIELSVRDLRSFVCYPMR